MKLTIKKTTRFIISSALSLFTVFFFTIPNAIAAPINYKILAPLPGIGEAGTVVSKLPEYLKALFQLAIGGAAVLAVVMITIGGIQYMSTDAISGKSEGKEKIKQALLGLLLAVASWLILYTINPKLIEFNLNIGATPDIEIASSTPPATQSHVYKVRICDTGFSKVESAAGTPNKFSFTEGNIDDQSRALVACISTPPAPTPNENPPAINCVSSKITCRTEPAQ